MKIVLTARQSEQREEENFTHVSSQAMQMCPDPGRNGDCQENGKRNVSNSMKQFQQEGQGHGFAPGTEPPGENSIR